MTKNEILEYFKDINYAYNDCTRYDTLKRMLDELQEPCTDAISRQAAIDACLNGWNKDYKEIVEEIRALPPVTATEKVEFCDDCVSRQTVINRIANTCFWLSADNWNELIKCINSISPVTPAEKVGQWEWVRYEGFIGNWHCSECRIIIPHMPEETDNTPIYKWCPMCGAKMQEVEE